MIHSKSIRWALVALLAATLLTGCGFRRKKYENPIGKDTEQPDKVLFDKAGTRVNVSDLEEYQLAQRIETELAKKIEEGK